MSVEMFDYMDEILNLQSASKCFLFVVNMFETIVAGLSSNNDFLELGYVKCFDLIGYIMMLSLLRLYNIGWQDD
jgi:hypothetical protein